MDLATALKVIDSGEVFSCKVVSFDARRKTGGEIKEYAELVGSRKIAERVKNPLPTKAQNHFDNGTRNVLICTDGEPTAINRKIHIFFLLEVNGETVKL